MAHPSLSLDKLTLYRDLVEIRIDILDNSSVIERKTQLFLGWCDHHEYSNSFGNLTGCHSAMIFVSLLAKGGLLNPPARQSHPWL